MRHVLLSRFLLRRQRGGGGVIPTAHHHHLLRALSSASSPVSSDAELRKYAGYALLLVGCGAATYYSFPLPADALHKKAVSFRYAPLPEDLHAVAPTADEGLI
jgi:L-galactono-1,4-lactone dehydrogenase